MAARLDSLLRAALRAAVRAYEPPPALRQAVLRAAGRRQPGAEAGANWWETPPVRAAWLVQVFRIPLVT